MLDDHLVSAPLEAGAKVEVATSKNRSFDRTICCDKILAWDEQLSHLVEASSEAETWGSSGDVHTLDDHQVSAPFDAGAKAEIADRDVQDIFSIERMLELERDDWRQRQQQKELF
jgi:hypothetical protein